MQGQQYSRAKYKNQQMAAESDSGSETPGFSLREATALLGSDYAKLLDLAGNHGEVDYEDDSEEDITDCEGYDNDAARSLLALTDNEEKHEWLRKYNDKDRANKSNLPPKAEARHVLGQRKMPEAPVEWSNNLPVIEMKPYTEEAGPKCYLPYDAPELDFLMCLIGNDFFEGIARTTNLNAATTRPPDEPDPDNELASQADRPWTPTDSKEMKALFAIHMLMGVTGPPGYEDCWSQDTALRNDFISCMMTKNRYEKLCQYFDCSHELNLDGVKTVIPKVGVFVKTLKENFPRRFTPGQTLCVEEAIIKNNGKLIWKRYMPSSSQRGIKIWCLCDSVSGYCLNVQVYMDKGVDAEMVRPCGLGYAAVMELTKGHVFKNHHVYADDFFSSVTLADDLLQAETYFCGILQKDKAGVPPEMTATPTTTYDNIKWSKDNGTVTKWHDKEIMYFVSTNNAGDDNQKRRTHPQQDVVSVPSVFTDYNTKMSGANHTDKLRGTYNVSRIGRRWWKYLMSGLFNLAVINAYILWEVSSRPHERNKRKWSLKSFKMAIVHQLADGYSSRKRKSSADCGRPIEKVVAQDVVPGHSLVAFGDRKKVCMQCKQEGRKARGGNSVQTKFGCNGCRINLCRNPCFNDWHNI